MTLRPTLLLIMALMLTAVLILPAAAFGYKEAPQKQGKKLMRHAGGQARQIRQHIRPFLPVPVPVPVPLPVPIVTPPRRGHHHHGGHCHRGPRCGGRYWVPPAYQRIWEPGYYDRYGCWVPGRWIEVVQRPGYWEYGGPGRGGHNYGYHKSGKKK